MALTLNGSANTITPVSAVQPTGAILQVLQAVKTDTFSNSNEAWADITGVSVAITPASSSNKILVNYGGLMGSGSNYMGHIRLVRDSTTDVFVGAQGESSQARASSTCAQNNIYYVSAFTGQFLDSPSTTSATTYKLQIAAGDESQTVYIGRDFQNSNEFSRSRTPTWITVIEVAG